ncbi:MAG: hypothetical protein GWN58_61980, partial [Anaerolineae bacterium]|nr:hypothetical protein [Anaerolineae bacterium]
MKHHVIPILLGLGGTFPLLVAAATKPLIEEIIVSAQRVEENAQQVPMSLSAFTDTNIEDRQIIGLL